MKLNKKIKIYIFGFRLYKLYKIKINNGYNKK